MKFNAFLFCILLGLSTTLTHAQQIRDLFGKKPKDSIQPGKTKVGDLFKKTGAGLGSTSLSTDEVAQGLKEALEKGAERGIKTLGVSDGYLGNQLVKIMMPPEAKRVEQTLRNLGMGTLVNDAITAMNRAAEDAAQSAMPILWEAIRKMTIQDAWSILRGADTAATAYLRKTTAPAIAQAFKPIVEASLKKVDATRYWELVFSNYNKVAAQKVNPNLNEYVTQKALDGIFVQLGEEEKSIRKNPAARTTDLLKKVFGQSDNAVKSP